MGAVKLLQQLNNKFKSIVLTGKDYKYNVVDVLLDNIKVLHITDDDIYEFKSVEDYIAIEDKSTYSVEGVVIISGNKRLVVAIRQELLPWGTIENNPNILRTTSCKNVLQETNGYYATKLLMQNEGTSEEGTAAYYAIHYTSGFTHCIPEGSWYMPSVQEMQLIITYKEAINYVLSYIPSAIIITNTYYLCASDYNNKYCWYASLSQNYVGIKNIRNVIRPVCDLSIITQNKAGLYNDIPKYSKPGDTYYATDLDKLCVYDGVKWKDTLGYDANLKHKGYNSDVPTAEQLGNDNIGFEFFNLSFNPAIKQIWNGINWTKLDGTKI